MHRYIQIYIYRCTQMCADAYQICADRYMRAMQIGTDTHAKRNRTDRERKQTDRPHTQVYSRGTVSTHRVGTSRGTVSTHRGRRTRCTRPSPLAAGIAPRRTPCKPSRARRARRTCHGGTPSTHKRYSEYSHGVLWCSQSVL